MSKFRLRLPLGLTVSLLFATVTAFSMMDGETLAASSTLRAAGSSGVAGTLSKEGVTRTVVRWNGQLLDPDPASYISHGVTMVPLSVIGKLTSLSAHWIPEEELVRIWMDRGGIYDFKPGLAEVRESAGEGRYPLPAPVVSSGGTVMLPLRFIAELAGADVTWNAAARTAEVRTGRTVLASLPGGGPRLFPMEKQEGTFKGMRLEWDGAVKSYPAWNNPVDAGHPPYMEVGDLDRDGMPEALVRLNAGWGTGLHLEEAHVVERRTFREVPVDDPFEAARAGVESSIARDGDRIVIRAEVAGKTEERVRSAGDYGNEAKEVGNRISFGSIVYYGIEDGHLTAVLGGQVGIADFVGDARVVYRYDKGRYRADKVTFSFYPPQP